MFALIDGIGPEFRITLEVSNVSSHVISHLSIHLAYDSNTFRIDGFDPDVGSIPANSTLPLLIDVVNIDEGGVSGNIHIFVLKQD